MTTLNHRIMGIRGWFIGLVFLYTTISLGTNQRDSIVIDKRWNYWSVNNISDNGDWIGVYLNYPNNRADIKTFVIHTGSKKKIEVTGIDDPQFMATDILLGKSDKGIVEINLKKEGKQTFLGKVKQQDWIEANQVLCYVTDNNGLILRRYEKKREIDLMTIPRVSKYYLSPSKTQLLYQKEGDYEVYVLDVSTAKEKPLIQINEELNNLIWNTDETAVVVPLKDGRLQFIDLKNELNKTIEVPSRSEVREILNVSFFPNNDIYFESFVEIKEDNPEKEYLDIWNGNDRELKYKVLPKIKGEWSTYIYHQKTNMVSELPTSEKQRYWNVGVDNHLLVFEPLELQDYTSFVEQVRYRIFDLETMREREELTTVGSLAFFLNKSPNNRYIVYPQGKDWEMYDFKAHERLTVPHRDRYSKPIWSADSKSVYYSNGQNLMKLNVESGKGKCITNLSGENHFSFENESQLGNSRYIAVTKPFLFSIRHKYDNMSYYSLYKDKVVAIVDNTPNRLNLQYLKRGISENGETVVWTEENYNLPPTVKVYNKGKVKTLLESKVPKELYSWQKQKVIHYKDKYGVDLTGVLWYPKGFETGEKYPMITHIYAWQKGKRSIFEYATLLEGTGYNRILLNEQGYFVFLPDTYVSDDGAGLSALENVTKGVEAIMTEEPNIDKTKLGLIGHSFGGYETSFILSKTNLFTAGVSGAGVHDLVNFNYEYNYALNRPNFFRVEGPQIDLKVSFGENLVKYYNNSPIHFAQDYKASILLWTGMQDDNSNWKQTQYMYVALQRYKKSVIALFYKGEGHSLRRKKAQLDLTYRVLDWFDYYLKGKKEIEWINKGIDYDNY